MGIALFFAAASNLRGELKVDLVVPSTRTCVHLHPVCIGSLAAIFQAPKRCFEHGNSYGAEDCIEAQNAGTGLVVRCETAYCLGH
jgi:hypothetical protein